MNLRQIQFWEDEAGWIEDLSLDYEKTITRKLALLQTVRERFLDIDESTY
jgi:hypothetical protein